MNDYGTRDSTTTICDEGCEVQCPLMRVGRVCPSIAGHRAEMRELRMCVA